MKYLVNILGKIMDFREGHLIIMGDLNFCMEPELDSTARTQGKGSAQLKEVKQNLSFYQLVDIWRVQHLGKRDFTFYSPVHGSYSRIDYGLVEHREIDNVVESRIGNITYSDHAPMTLEMRTGGNLGGMGQWRLNEELIREDEGINRIRKELENYFVVNDNGEVSGATLWEAHKAFIRGVLIEMGARRKKERSEKIQKLIADLAGLQQKHKKQLGQSSRELHQQMVIKRSELKMAMELESRTTYSKIEWERYRWGNKPSKYLAKKVQKKKARNFIERIQTKEGHKEYSSRKIADTFKKY